MPRTTNPWAASVSATAVENPETLLLTLADAARLLRVCKRTVERLVGRGELPVIRVGRAPRISRTALMRWLESGSVAAGVASKETGNGESGF